MQWILDHLQLVVIGGLAIAGWLKSRLDARAERQAGDEEPWTSGDAQEAPPAAGPRPFVPPPVVRTTAPPPLRSAPPERRSGPPPLRDNARAADETAAELRHQQQIADRLAALKESRAANALTLEPRPRRPSTAFTKVPAVPLIALRKRLRDPAEIRAAIVLKEILGPPLGLR